MASEESLIDWLLAGDPAIRWQVLRDLLDEPPETWERERARVVEEGWVAELLGHQGEDGEWPAGRWTASTWTLLLLVALGLPEGHPAARRPLERLLDRFIPPDRELDGAALLKRVDLCHLGFWLGLGAHFLGDDPRLPQLGEAVLSAQYDDGGWNCQLRNYPNRRHSSFHTTFNGLENARPAAAKGLVSERAFHEAEARAVELMLAHRLYRSDRTGEVISERFTRLSYPWHWHYTVLRGLDYVRLTPAISDARLADAVDSCTSSASRTGAGRSRNAFPGRCSWRWRSPGRRAAGTPCARSAFCDVT